MIRCGVLVVLALAGRAPAGDVARAPRVTSQANARGPDDAALAVYLAEVARTLSVAAPAPGAVGERPRVWRVTVPDSADAAWQGARARLLAQVGGQAAARSDSVVQVVRLEALTVDGARLEGRFFVGARFRCGARLAGGGTAYVVSAWSVGGRWGSVRTSAVRHEDSLCPATAGER